MAGKEDPPQNTDTQGEIPELNAASGTRAPIARATDGYADG